MLLYVLGNIILATSANVCLKLYTREGAHQITPLFLLAYLLNASSFALLYFSLNANAMAVNQVFVSSGIIVSSCVCGVILFDETFSWMKFASVVFALTSFVLMYYANATLQSDKDAADERVNITHA